MPTARQLLAVRPDAMAEAKRRILHPVSGKPGFLPTAANQTSDFYCWTRIIIDSMDTLPGCSIDVDRVLRLAISPQFFSLSTLTDIIPKNIHR